MQAGLRDQAKALARALAATEEYQRLVAAQREVAQHEAARIMLRDLRALQRELERKQLAGEPISESEIQQLQQRSQLVAFNPYVRELLEAEIAFAQLMLEVQAVIHHELGLDADEEGEATAADAGGEGARSAQDAGRTIVKPSSRLWIPS